MANLWETHVDDLRATLAAWQPRAAPALRAWGRRVAATLSRGGRLIAAGNGGSAAQAQHLVAELVGKLDADRPPLSAITLTAEGCGVTAIGNDYGFDEVFARQVRAHARSGDVVALLSTSGASPNVLRAADAARAAGALVVALTGRAPNPLAARAEAVLAVPSDDPQVVQEIHLIAIHLLCAEVDAALGVPARSEISGVEPGVESHVEAPALAASVKAAPAKAATVKAAPAKTATVKTVAAGTAVAEAAAAPADAAQAASAAANR